MNPTPTAETIFHAARAVPPGERAAYLEGACGEDAALRAYVEALLQADADAGDFLAERAEHSQSNLQPDLVEQAGDRIGHYKLLQQIGEGGFGTVWMAEQSEPVRRKVALKILKLGMDTRQVVARFEAERQALAMMDHPHIAKVFDAGATQTGRPYFAMELVKGAPIVEYADTNHLTITERLDLFAQVCHAVQHAHGKGIIHRDLKPGNLLVGTQDGRPHAKVIDFGIAKAISQNLTDKTLFTEHEQVIGSLLHMSPEQLEGSLDIDTRTDVYSLGVVLYELLVGEPPFSQAELQRSGLMEMQRILREVEPKKPSTRITASNDTIASLAAHRHTEPRRLGGLVRGDLDWIVMKALEKDRARRYETVNGLVMDIQRHVAGEAVTAAPPSAGYRLRKFVRRHKAAVIAGTALAVVLVAGFIGTSYGMVWALNEKGRADALVITEAAAKEQAQQNEQKAVAAAARAEAAKEEEARVRKRAETITEFVTTALNSSDPNNTGGKQEMTIREAMDNAIADLDSGRFRDDPEIEAELMITIATILRSNGRAASAEPLAQKALATRRQLHPGDHPDLAQAVNNLALMQQSLGRPAAAEPLFTEALAMHQRLYEDAHPDLAATMNNLAMVRQELGRVAEAEPLFVQALAMAQQLFEGDHPEVAVALNNLAGARQTLGRYAEAEPLLEQALEIGQRLYPGDHPQLASSLSNLGRARQSLRRVAGAEPLFVQALEMRQRLFKGDHPEVALALSNLAGARKALGRAAEAEPLCAEALAMAQRLYPGDHPYVALCLNNLGGVRNSLGRPAEAEPLHVQALEMSQRLFPGDHPDVAMALHNLATLRVALRDAAAAEPLIVQALAMYQRLYEGDHPAVARSLFHLGKVQRSLDRAAEAESSLLEAAAMHRRLFKGYHPGLALTLSQLGVLYWSQGRFGEAVSVFEELLSMREANLGRQHLDTLRAVANLGVNYKDAGRLAAAIPLLEEAFRASEQQPKLAWVRGQLLDAYKKAKAAADATDAGAWQSKIQALGG